MPTTLHATGGYAPEVVDRMLETALACAREGRVFALAGLQGSGKSTLAAQVAAAAASRGVRAVVLSIDDFYLDRPERLRLGREVHPLLATRGPPGTHDVALACDTIDRLLQGRAVALPRFDKIDDVRLPESGWPVVDDCGLVLFEGWFLRVPAQGEAALVDPINEVERVDDSDGHWRRYCNRALDRDFAPLWQRLPRMAFLQAPAFDVVPRWRWQQECTLQDANPGRLAMSRAQVERFVQLFERVSLQALATLPSIADWTLRLDAQRRPADVDLAALAAPRPLPTIAR